MATTIEYSDPDIFTKAWTAIDQRLPVDIIVRGWRVPFVRRALPLCEALFDGRGRSVRRRLDALQLGLYGWWSAATLVGIYHHALFTGMMTVEWRETDGAIVVCFGQGSCRSD